MNDTAWKAYRCIQWAGYVLAVCGLWGMLVLIVYTTFHGGAEDPTWLAKDIVYTGVFWLLVVIASLNKP